MVYKCDKCNKIFDEKHLYLSHLNRKTPCNPVIEPDKTYDFTCMYCGRPFGYKSTLVRHQNSCKMKNSKLSLARRAPVVENKINENNIDNSVGKNNSIEGNHNHQQNTTNNITNNYYITNPNILIYDRQNVVKMIDTISKNDKLQDGFERLKAKITGYIKKNKPHKIFSIMLNFLHDNRLFPEGQNIFMGNKGDLKDVYITRQEDGWAKTRMLRIIATTWFELSNLIKSMDLDMEHPNTKKCIDTLNDHKNFESEFIDSIEIAVNAMSLSKTNPPIDKLLKEEAKKEAEKPIPPPEAQNLFKQYDEYYDKDQSKKSTNNTTDVDEMSSDELAIGSEEEREYLETRNRRIADGRDSEDDSDFEDCESA